MEKAMVGTGMFDGTHLRYPSRKLPFNWLHRFHPFYGNTKYKKELSSENHGLPLARYPDLFHKKNHGHIPTEIAAYLVTHPF
jgi:hypothetical protein